VPPTNCTTNTRTHTRTCMHEYLHLRIHIHVRGRSCFMRYHSATCSRLRNKATDCCTMLVESSMQDSAHTKEQRQDHLSSNLGDIVFIRAETRTWHLTCRYRESNRGLSAQSSLERALEPEKKARRALCVYRGCVSLLDGKARWSCSRAHGLEHHRKHDFA
jgi:hypothetical protein